MKELQPQRIINSWRVPTIDITCTQVRHGLPNTAVKTYINFCPEV